MLAINTFDFHNVIVFSCICCESVHLLAEPQIPQPLVPKVTARWSVATDKDGTRRLVQHWFKNDDLVHRYSRSSR